MAHSAWRDCPNAGLHVLADLSTTRRYMHLSPAAILSVDLKTNATARMFQSSMKIFKEGQQAIPGLGDEAVVASLYHQDVVVARKGTLLVTLVGPPWTRSRPGSESPISPGRS